MADICKLNINGVIYDIKDSIARAIIETLQNEGYLKSTDVIDSLVSTNSTAPLSANQGRQLNINKIDNISINGNILTFYANGTSKGTITLPTQSSNGGLTAEQATQLLTAYTHSQSSHAPSNAEQNVQSDWNVTDNNSDAYIKNKPTKISSFTNDSKYATETFVTTKIAEAQLNGGEVDLSGYATKSEIPTKTSQLENDSGYITDISNLKLAYDSSTGVINLTYNNNIISSITIDISKKTYSIVNNLNNATTNNISGNIEEGSSYSAIITANIGYEISSITVTMGGTDITSSAVNGNNINIPNVTGNIVITVNTSVSESGRELTTTILNMQYASAHEVLPNAPIDDVWKDRPREGKGSTIPTQNCTECASGTHTASESYSAGSLWSTFGQWATIYKIKGTNLVENVGVEITDFKMWRYNENTNQWVLVNDTFDYGAFYYETFWNDGSAPLNDHKILSSDKKTYKCLMDSQTNGRCFHPFSAQKKWSNYGFTTNPSYIVVQMKARLIVWDENGADNRASANLCMNVCGDYWIRQGASFDDQWRHNGDMMIGYFKKITNDWRYVYMTTCPNTWDKGFPCDSATDSGSGDATSDPIELTLPSSMTCTKGEVFNITYNTNIEAVKHEMSWDGGTTYGDITSDIIADGTNYTYAHEAINDTTWNPVSRYIRVTDSDGNISIGSISITIVSNNFTATYNLTNCTTDNSSASVLEGDSYLSTITANDEYMLTNVSVTMDGVNVTNSVYSQLSYAVINSLTNCTSDNSTKEISYGSSYSATITANDGYDISSIKVIMNGIDITDDVIEESE